MIVNIKAKVVINRMCLWEVFGVCERIKPIEKLKEWPKRSECPMISLKNIPSKINKFV